MKKQRGLKNKSSGIPSLLFGVLINAAIYTALVFVFTVIAFFGDNPTGLSRIFSLAALLITGVIGGVSVGKRSEGAYTALFSALAFSIIMLLLGVIISNTAPGVGNFINYIIYIIISAVFSRLAAKKKDRVKFKRR